MKQWTKDGHEYKKFRHGSLDAIELAWKFHFPDGWDVDKEIKVRGLWPKYEFTIKRALDRKVCRDFRCNKTADEFYDGEPEQGFCGSCGLREGNLRSARIIENLGKEKANEGS